MFKRLFSKRKSARKPVPFKNGYERKSQKRSYPNGNKRRK